MEPYLKFHEFIDTLTRNLSGAINHNIIPSECLSGQTGNRERMLHGRMLWMLGKTGDALDYVVEIDSGFTPTRARQFRPDVQLWTKGQAKLQFLIEYESTNSQDSRVLWKDLQHYADSEGHEFSPEYWIILYTFPDHPVDKLPPWIRRDPNFSSFDVGRFKRNPHSYFRNVLDSEMSNYIDHDVEWEKRKLLLMNLTSTNLEIDYPKHLQKKYYF